MLTALFESSVIRTLMFAITCKWNKPVSAHSLQRLSMEPTGDTRSKTPSCHNKRLKLTSGDTLWVPYLSSQYIVLIRYSCWTLNTCGTTTIVSTHARFSTFHCIRHCLCKHVQTHGHRLSLSSHSTPTYRAQIVGDLIERLLRLLMDDLQRSIHSQYCCTNHPTNSNQRHD